MRNGWRRPIGAADLAAACLRSFSERAWRRGTTKNSSFARHQGFVRSAARATRPGARCSCRLDAIALSRRRRLLLDPACVPLIGFVAADDASCNSADFAVPCQMARDAADDSALDTSLCLNGGRDKRYPQNRGVTPRRLLHRLYRGRFGADADNLPRICNITPAWK